MRRTQRQPRVGRTNQIMDVAHKPSIMRLERNVFGFPKRLVTKLRYGAGEGLLIPSTAGSLGKYFFSCNSIFDPDRTATGHQPLYHDTYQGIYDHYAVIDSKLTYRFINTSTSYFNAGCTIEDDSGGTTVVDTVIEQSTGLTTLIGPVSSSHSYYQGVKTWNCMRDLNIDPYTSEQYKANFGSNPVEESAYMLWANDAGGGSNNLLFQAIIEYTVLFTELQTPTQS